MKEKHMFAGVNSPKGFFSRFDHIMPELPDGRKIFIKGGPGTGKSSLMKKVIKQAAAEELDCEVFHCSSDPSSIDGVHIPALKTAILDATAPHNGDPLYPCIGGELFDVSPFIQKEKLKFEPDEVMFYSLQKKRSFTKGYYYLSAALPLLRHIDSEYTEKTDIREIYLQAEKLAHRVLEAVAFHDAGGKRELFISAITPEGFVNYADTVFSNTYSIAVKGRYGTALFMRRFAEIAGMKGFSPILFYCPMRLDEKMEHIYIPEINISITTYDYYTHASSAETIDLDTFIYSTSSQEESRGYANILMQQAIDAFAEAKNAHTRLEKIYIPAMDFDGLNERTKSLIDSIF